MLSVLIPIFNYDVCDLVYEIHKQLLQTNRSFEIICMEDGSELEFIEKNDKIKLLENTIHINSTENYGRLKTRKLLYEMAKYEWLLFLDADVLPKSTKFINNYIDAIHSDTEVIFGGFTYYETPPDKELLLRWKYGRSNEQVSASKRNLKPYKLVISANFLIKKSILSALNLETINNQYGYDSYFSSQLKENQINVEHFDNEVFHLGIEKSEIYLKKKEQAARTLLFLYNKNHIKTHDNSLLKMFVFLKRYGLNRIMSAVYSVFNKSLRRNLIGPNPSVNLLQIYRICYLCNQDLKVSD